MKKTYIVKTAYSGKTAIIVTDVPSKAYEALMEIADDYYDGINGDVYDISKIEKNKEKIIILEKPIRYTLSVNYKPDRRGKNDRRSVK